MGNLQYLYKIYVKRNQLSCYYNSLLLLEEEVISKTNIRIFIYLNSFLSLLVHSKLHTKYYSVSVFLAAVAILTIYDRRHYEFKYKYK